MWRFRKRKIVRRKRATTVTKHYVEHKEAARALVLARLAYFNQYYNLHWNRVAIRNQRRCWGSCSSAKNLNFNYKILLLPPHLRDYIIVHELCHLVHLHHGQTFWDLVAEQMPNYKQFVRELREVDKLGGSVVKLAKLQADYPLRATAPVMPMIGVETMTAQSTPLFAHSVVDSCNCDTGSA